MSESERNTFDLLGMTNSVPIVEKKATNLEVLRANQELIDKAIKAGKLRQEAQKLQAEYDEIQAQIMKDGERIEELVKNYDSSLDRGLYEILPESVTVRQLQRIAELHKDLTTQGYKIRLLRYSHSSENDWIAWKPSILRGNISIEIVTRKIETDEYTRLSFDVSGEVESINQNLLSIELKDIDFDEADRKMLTEYPQLISLANNTQSSKHKVSFRHSGIKLIVPNPALHLPAKIVFMLIENDISQVEAQVISAMTEPLKHLKG